MAEYLQFQTETMILVYSCDSHSPLQRGSNENTNELICQGIKLNLYSPERISEVAAKGNA